MGLRPLSLLLPSPARRTSHFFIKVLVGEGFILRVHPEGSGVRLISVTECKQSLKIQLLRLN